MMPCLERSLSLQTGGGGPGSSASGGSGGRGSTEGQSYSNGMSSYVAATTQQTPGPYPSTLSFPGLGLEQYPSTNTKMGQMQRMPDNAGGQRVHVKRYNSVCSFPQHLMNSRNNSSSMQQQKSGELQGVSSPKRGVSRAASSLQFRPASFADSPSGSPHGSRQLKPDQQQLPMSMRWGIAPVTRQPQQQQQQTDQQQQQQQQQQVLPSSMGWGMSASSSQQLQTPSSLQQSQSQYSERYPVMDASHFQTSDSVNNPYPTIPPMASVFSAKQPANSKPGGPGTSNASGAATYFINMNVPSSSAEGGS
jgi:hypothetical protein